MKKTVLEVLTDLINQTGSTYITYEDLCKKGRFKRKDIIEACKDHEIMFDSDT